MRILVLCTGNSCRSQMAEGFLRKFGGGNIEVFSAGLEPKRVNPYAVMAMEEIGIDISKHWPKHVDTYIGEPFDYVITVCDNAAERCPTFPGEGSRLHWPFDDPSTSTEEEIINEFRRVRDQIGSRILQWLVEMKKKGEVV